MNWLKHKLKTWLLSDIESDLHRLRRSYCSEIESISDELDKLNEKIKKQCIKPCKVKPKVETKK